MRLYTVLVLAAMHASRTHLTYVSFGMVLGPVAHGVDADVDPYLSAFSTLFSVREDTYL